MKNKPEIFALEDSEYPDWLWTLLDDSKKQSTAETGGVDPSSKRISYGLQFRHFLTPLTALNRKLRKRHEKKMAALAASLPRKIPLHEQSIDITPAPYNRADAGPKDPLAEAAASLEKMSEITKSARDARRKGIRESNFLRGL
jgi:large subunit ribosomal protein L54